MERDENEKGIGLQLKAASPRLYDPNEILEVDGEAIFD